MERAQAAALGTALLTFGIMATLRFRDDSMMARHGISLDQHAVRAAAAQCSADPACVPSVEKLVGLASSYCAKEPACVCDWSKRPRECFFMEVQKHPKLMVESKMLEDSVKQREEIHREEQRVQRILHNDEGKFAGLIDRGHEALSRHDSAFARADVRKAEALHKIMQRLVATATRPGAAPGIARHDVSKQHLMLKRQSRQLDGLAYSILKESRGREPERHSHDEDPEHGLWYHILQKGSRQGRREMYGKSHRMQRGRGERGERGRVVGEEGSVRRLRSRVRALTREVASMRRRRREQDELSVGFGRQSSGSVITDSIRSLVKVVGNLAGKVSSLGKQAGWHGHERLTTYEREFAKAVARGEDDVAKHEYVHAVQALRRARFYHAGIARLKLLSPNAPCHACQALQSTIKLAQKAQRDSTEEKADLSWHPPRPSQDSDGMGGADEGPTDLVPGPPRHSSAFVDHVNHDGNKAAQSSLDRRERAGTRRRFGNLTAKQWAAARHIANEGCVLLACLCAFVLLCLTWLLVLG